MKPFVFKQNLNVINKSSLHVCSILMPVYYFFVDCRHLLYSSDRSSTQTKLHFILYECDLFHEVTLLYESEIVNSIIFVPEFE